MADINNQPKNDTLVLDDRGNYCLNSEVSKINETYKKEIEDAKKVLEAKRETQRNLSK